MIRLEPLASSSAGCAYVLRADGAAPLLLDCGLSHSIIRNRLGFPLTRLAGCLVSHSHGDHCKAVMGLLTSTVPVYASPETFEALNIKHHRAYPVTAGAEFVVGEWTVRAVDCVHDCPGTLGFLLATGRYRALYLTDTAYSKYRFDGLTHLFVECNHSQAIMRDSVRAGSQSRDRYRRTANNHMSLERLLNLLKANDLSKCEEIVLLHLSDANSDEDDFRRQVQAATGIPVKIAGKAGGVV